MSENERETARLIANEWLDFQMNALTDMVPGDPDCNACILARQYMRALDTINSLQEFAVRLWSEMSDEKTSALITSKWPRSTE